MNGTNEQPAMPKTKQHFIILDGLRGVAALSVVLFHFMEMFITDYSKNFIGHGFLAVDFFFCLSGFVIGYAYDDRMAKTGIAGFLKARAIRLHPLVILGSVLGLLAFFLNPFGGDADKYSVGNVFLIFITSLLLIPFPVMKERSFNLFGLNAPAWSLFWEYVANIVYAFVLCRLNKKYLVALLIISAIGLGYVSYSAGNVMGGWGADTFWHGSARISFSFLAGLLIFRCNWIIKSRIGFVGLSVLLMLAFTMPFFKWNWLAELLVVLFYFPLLIALGAGATLRPVLRKICEFSGNISYPLYMTHYMVIWIFMYYNNTQKPSATELAWVISITTVLLVAFAYLAMRFYDGPVRRYLTAKWKKQ